MRTCAPRRALSFLMCALMLLGMTGAAAPPARAAGITQNVLAGWEFDTKEATIALPIAASYGDLLDVKIPPFVSTFSHSGRESVRYEDYAVYADGWDAAGRYWQIDTSTERFGAVRNSGVVTVNFCAWSSHDGPKNFVIEYSAGGNPFSIVTSIELELFDGNYTPFEIPLPEDADGAENLSIRLRAADTASVGGGAVTPNGVSYITDLSVTKEGVPRKLAPPEATPVPGVYSNGGKPDKITLIAPYDKDDPSYDEDDPHKDSGALVLYAINDPDLNLRENGIPCYDGTIADLPPLPFTIRAISVLEGEYSPEAELEYKETGGYGYLDKIVFSDEGSLTDHLFSSDACETVTNAVTGEKAIKATPTTPVSFRAGDLVFTMKVDPYLQNYFTAKFWGGDNALESVVIVDNVETSYRGDGDYMALNNGYNAPFANRYYYGTVVLPLETTYGKDSVTITIRSGSGTTDNYFNSTVSGGSRSAGFYSAYTHTQAYLNVEGEVQGDSEVWSSGLPGGAARTEAETRNEVVRYNTTQQSHYNTHKNTVDGGSLLSITRYNDSLKQFAGFVQHGLFASGNEETAKDLERIFKVIDGYVKQYYANVRTVGRNAHQSDWGGYYSALGEALYMVQNQIFDDGIYGRAKFEAFLREPLVFGTVEGEYSLSGADAGGNPITRFEAWERCLKATYDFARSRLSYIYNQVMFTYEGAWKALEGLNVIGSPIFEEEGGKAKSNRILREALGLSPFLGEEVLTGPNGEELDLYHDLFLHDTSFVATEDCQKIVMRGLAKSKRDENGEQVRARPFGDHYTTMSEAGLCRENNYVANYGEVGSQYFPEYFFKTLDQPGDEALNDDILKGALRNISGRSFTRYSSVVGNRRVIRMNQVLDERNPAWPGTTSYNGRPTTLIPFASLEWHMANHEERYSGPEWDKYWEYAAQAVGFVQQMIVDNQFYEAMTSAISTATSEPNVIRRNFFLTETYDYITKDRAGFDRFDGVSAERVYPFTNLDLYTEDEITKLLGSADTGVYDQFAWVDIDTLFVSVKDGGTSLMASLMILNRTGLSGVGRLQAFHKEDGREYSVIANIATNNKFIYEDYNIRQSDLSRSFARYSQANASLPFALTGEPLPNAYRPGVGTVTRENSNEDHGYSGYPDLSVSRYGKYFMIINTTRDVFENAQSFTVELPADFSGDSALDLVSGAMIPVVDGAVTIPAKTAYVLKLTSDVQTVFKPSHVDFAKVFAGNGYAGIMWKKASGGESYTVTRSDTEDGEYAAVASGLQGFYYEDRTVESGKTYFYKVFAVNGAGAGWESYRAGLSWDGAADSVSGWFNTVLGGAGAGSLRISGDSISVSGAGGSGLGAGDDFVMAKRDINDSVQFINKLQEESFELQARVTGASGPLSGLMIREELSSNCRYLYFGADANGRLTLANRTKDTRWNNADGGGGSSPSRAVIGSYYVDEYPYLRLVRDAGIHVIFAYASKDGADWRLVGYMDTPMLQPVYAGFAATGSAGFDGVSVNSIVPSTAPGPVSVSIYSDINLELLSLCIELSWELPLRAVCFRVERSVNGGEYETLVEAQTALAYTDSDPAIRAGDTYTYRVTPISADGQHGEATEASILVENPPIIDVMTEAAAFNEAYPFTGEQSGMSPEQKAARLFAIRTPGATQSDYIDLRGSNGSGAGGWLSVDFGEGKAVRVDRARMFPRLHNNLSARMAGTFLEGSNDYVNWMRVTASAVSSAAWQTVPGTDPDTAYRYIRVTNSGTWYGNMSCLIIYGEVVTDTILDVSVSTPTIVAALAAYLNVTVAGAPGGVDLKAYLEVGGELLYETDIADGKGRMYIPAAPDESCKLVVKGDGYRGGCGITIKPYSLDIWEANVSVRDEKLLIVFNEDMTLKAPADCVTVGGRTYGARVREDQRTVEVLGYDASKLASGAGIVIKGVKYPELFPSYSFTFTISAP